MSFDSSASKIASTSSCSLLNYVATQKIVPVNQIKEIMQVKNTASLWKKKYARTGVVF